MPDGGTCAEDGTDADRIRDRDDHRVGALQSLCSWHHAGKTAEEADTSEFHPSS
ncbi:hypothetical protein HNR06_004290 [Nocardiopsis arvandica]|uniref:HNH endonuclease n=1 Tax=Nocardiopsis sinuspersici TaxID=501010 RepID=A0A7Y9XF57_9ACTN|nr:hypothetical protein [Nocardiopsis sinuspersici]NYH54701.1 hypothetical protein [Nocardiopsis sinuspersici]